MTRVPSRNEVIIPMAKHIAKLIVNSAHTHITNVNKYLKNFKSDIVANFICITNNGIVITTNKLANNLNLSTIEKYLKSIQNVNSDSIKSPRLPKSKLYMKIIGLPYKIEQDVISPDYIESILKETHLFKDVMLASKPHVIKASPKSDIVVVWVNIQDSQSGSLVKNIINHHYCQRYQYEPRCPIVQELLEVGTFDTQLPFSYLQVCQVLWSSYYQIPQRESIVLYRQQESKLNSHQERQAMSSHLQMHELQRGSSSRQLQLSVLAQLFQQRLAQQKTTGTLSKVEYSNVAILLAQISLFFLLLFLFIFLFSCSLPINVLQLLMLQQPLARIALVVC